MKVEEVLHMVGGTGPDSYSANSRHQGIALSQAKFILQETISSLCCRLLQETPLRETLAVADLGCSSGPNTFTVVSTIIETIGDTCRKLGRSPPEVHFFLNDLPGNDFNAIFRSLPSFKKKVEEERVDKETVPLYVVGMPGSFYEKLFPNKSMHFMHSSYSLHYLSQVPRALDNNAKALLNKGNVYISKRSPPFVFEAYLAQFKRDFYSFLELRSKEIIHGGSIVITLLGRRTTDGFSGKYFPLWDLLADSLNDLVSERIIQEEDVDAFNLPFYAPSMEEVKDVVQYEGSFDIKQEHIFETNWDGYDERMDSSTFNNAKSGEIVANSMRAVLKPLLSHHFGEAIIAELFSRYANNIARHLMTERTKYVNLVISLEKLA